MTIAHHAFVRVRRWLAAMARLGGISLLGSALVLPTAALCACALVSANDAVASMDAHACCREDARPSVALSGDCCVARPDERPVSFEPTAHFSLSQTITHAAPAPALDASIVSAARCVATAASPQSASPPLVPLRV
jgi:hypothetical protein